MRLAASAPGHVDRGLLASTLLLAVVSGVTMVSAGATVSPTIAPRHAMWIVIGVMCSLLTMRTNFRRWTDLTGLAYGISLAALILVPLAGAMRLGATRWLSVFGVSMQPSELAKLTTVWLLARYLAGQPSPLPARVVGTSLLLAGPPALLIFLQPDLGSASIFAAIWLGMVWAAGISRRALVGFGACLLGLLPVAWFVLKGYQRDRLLTFINPHADPLGTGYTIIQSTIAIGSGQFLGRGWLAGTQNQLSFLPEHHSDFIFSVIGEEWGWVGCCVVVALFTIMLLRIAHIALATSDPQGRLLATGVFAWIGYQAFVNMGMVMGLLPVVGVPLPLISYGGSSMVALWLALGLVQSVRRMS